MSPVGGRDVRGVEEVEEGNGGRLVKASADWVRGRDGGLSAARGSAEVSYVVGGMRGREWGWTSGRGSDAKGPEK